MWIIVCINKTTISKSVVHLAGIGYAFILFLKHHKFDLLYAYTLEIRKGLHFGDIDYSSISLYEMIVFFFFFVVLLS